MSAIPLAGVYWALVGWPDGDKWEIASVEDSGAVYAVGTDCPYWPREIRLFKEWRRIEPPA